MGNQAAVLKKFPYEIGEVYGETFLWKLHHGKKKATQEHVTILAFEINDRTRDRLDLARNSFKRLKTIRHPNIIKFLDGVELQTHIYVVTEYVHTLSDSLKSMFVEIGYNEAVSWGLYQVIHGLDFLHSRRLAHGAISIHSIFMDAAGDWKIGELGFMTELSAPGPNDPNYGQQELVMSDFAIRTFSHHIQQKYRPPEILANRWDIVEKLPHKLDSWGLACLIYEVFEGEMNSGNDLKKVTTKIPKAIQYSYNQLLLDDPMHRGGMSDMLQLPYFNNNMIKTQLFLENMSLKDPVSIETFLGQLPEMLPNLPKKNCKFRILPHLINAIKYGSGGSKAIIPIFQIGEMMTQEEFKSDFIPKILDLFESTDRTVRVNLLKNINTIMPHLSVDHVEQRVYPHVSKGFRDSSPVVREMTVKSMIDIVPKLTENTVSENVIRYLWALQGDKEPAIRTNTIIALGKLSRNLSEKTRKRILLPAFARSLKDPFVHSRMACLKALMSTRDLYTPAEMATKALPAVIPLAVDPNKGVRDLAIQCTNYYLEVIVTTSNSANFEAVAGIDPVVAADVNSTSNTATDNSGTAGPSTVTHSNGNQSDDPGYLGWAVSSVSSLKSKIVGEKTNIGADIKKPLQQQPQHPVVNSTPTPQTTQYQPPPTSKSPSTDMFGDSQMVIKQPSKMQISESKPKVANNEVFGDFEVPDMTIIKPKTTTPKQTVTSNAQKPQQKSSLNIAPYTQQTAFDTQKQSQTTQPQKGNNLMNTDNEFNFSEWDSMISSVPSNNSTAKSEEDFFNSVMNDDDIFGLGPAKPKKTQKSPSSRTTSSSSSTSKASSNSSDLFNFAPPPKTSDNTTKQQGKSASQTNVPANSRIAQKRQNPEDDWSQFSWDDMPK